MEFNKRFEKWKIEALKHGCVFDNLNFVEDEFGVKVKAVVENKICRLKVTEPLLIPRNGIELTNDSHRIMEAYCKNQELREVINDMLDYILKPEKIEQTIELIKSFKLLPDILKKRLRNMGLAPNLLYKKDESISEIKEKLLQARIIIKNNQTVFMPFVDFINHDANEGIGYDIQDSSIVVQGKPAENGELYAVYSNADSFHLLNTYFFPGTSNDAYSVGYIFDLDDGRQVTVGRKFGEFTMTEDGYRIPDIEIKNNKIYISNIWLGATNLPRRPWWSFEVLANKLDIKSAIKIYCRIVHFNWLKMIEILNLIDGNETVSAKLIKKAVLIQMEVLAHNLIEIKDE